MIYQHKDGERVVPADGSPEHRRLQESPDWQAVELDDKGKAKPVKDDSATAQDEAAR